ncbi:hypothetical protein M8J76_016710 [Diaphorina citri]|nr:hypothetical protein M8J76_016710 [Diaphorina citri]
MESLERLLHQVSPPTPATGSTNKGTGPTTTSLISANIGRKGRHRHLRGTFCLNGDTMEGIIQCLVFFKAFSIALIDRSRNMPPCR